VRWRRAAVKAKGRRRKKGKRRMETISARTRTVPNDNVESRAVGEVAAATSTLTTTAAATGTTILTVCLWSYGRFM
jgi:hypothetical protein